MSLLLALGGAVGCGDDSDKGGQDGTIVDRDPPNLTVNPSTIDFIEVPVGGEDRKVVKITNTGRGELRITNIELVENPGDNQTEFHRGPNWARTLNLKSGESHDLTVFYRPLNRTPDTGYIELTSNNPAGGGVTRIPLNSPNLAPRIFSPDTVRFSRVPAGASNWQVTQVQNIGQTPLRIDEIVLTGSDDFTVSFPEARTEAELGEPETDGDRWPEVIAPNEQFLVRVNFAPVHNDPSSAEMIFFTNDPQAAEYKVSLLGNSGSPCIAMNYDRELDFGESSIGQVATRTVIVENCSNSSTLRLTDIAIGEDADGVFGLRADSLPGNLPDEPFELEPRGSTTFVVTYTPEHNIHSEGQLVVRTNDPARSTVNIELNGSGTDNQCPEGVAEARLPGGSRYEQELTTLPLATIELTGVNSFDPDGNVTGYEWTVVTRPQGSNARPTPRSDIRDPMLYLDLAGTYEIELVVYDNQGLASCTPSKVTVHAVPQDDIHVQLIWDAPAVVNPSEGNGTDVDLHYLHPLGRWNHAPYDIFWNNPTADWGLQGDSADDPRLDIDDTFMGGPENINHSYPETGVNYGVGVYYFADRGFGAAYATLRIYIRGEMRFEIKNRYLPEQGYFWNAAVISWPSTEIIRRDRVEYGFPSR